MNNTFSVELQGLDLPDETKNSLQAQLRSTVLAEIAKIDPFAELSVKGLQNDSARVFVGQQILGFIVQKLSTPTVRANGDLSLAAYSPSLLFTPSHSIAELLAALGGTAAPPHPSLTDLLGPFYIRPDIRMAVAANARTLADLLSQDEAAIHALDDLTGGSLSGPERAFPLAAVATVVIGLALGGAIAYGIHHFRPQ